jgi:Uncharacterized protein conserved in bacteria (DUF2252)
VPGLRAGLRAAERPHRLQPPLVVPLEELAGHVDVDAVYWFLRRLFTGYTRTLPAYRRRLVERFTLTGVARKVVGVGTEA